MPFFRRRRGPALADGWQEIVEASLGVWPLLDDDEQGRLAGLLEAIVTTRRWEAAQGFELSDDAVTTIAAHAALLVLELGIDAYDDVSTIIVHPTTMRFEQTHAGDVAGTEVSGRVDLLGEASPGGPLLVAWDAARREIRHPRRGRNVVFHEFAHKLDMADRLVDGTPLLADPVQRARWIEVCTRAFDDLRRGDDHGLIDPYGATDPAEFFAVVTETFFTLPLALRDDDPDLYEVFRDFYRQDPAARVDVARAAGPDDGPGRRTWHEPAP